MNKLHLVVVLIASLLVLEAFAAIKLPLYRNKNPAKKRANAPLGGGISTAGEFYVQLQGKSSMREIIRFKTKFVKNIQTNFDTNKRY